MVTRARMFQYKPDGEVTFMTFQDAVGTPITPFQDPLHYPHGTAFLAPGACVSVYPPARRRPPCARSASLLCRA